MDIKETLRVMRQSQEGQEPVDDREFFELLRDQTREYENLIACYRSACMEITTKFNVMNEEFHLEYDRTPIVSLTSRIKKPQSIYEKMKRKGLAVSVENIAENLNDVAGIRVVCSFAEDVYMLADAFLSQDDVVLIEKKDYIKNPKPNGYRSLHLIVETPIFLVKEKHMMRAEIQFRTIAMDCWATLEHQINYKKTGADSDDLEELRLCAEMSSELDSRMEALWRKLR